MGLCCPRIWPSFEEPGVDQPSGWVDVQVRAPERALDAVWGHEDIVEVPSDAQVDLTDRHPVSSCSPPAAHVLRFRQDVEHERDWSVEPSSSDDLEFTRVLAHRGSMPVTHCCSPCRC